MHPGNGIKKMSLKGFLTMTNDNFPFVIKYEGKEYLLKYTSKKRLHMSRNTANISHVDNGSKIAYNNSVKGEFTEGER